MAEYRSYLNNNRPADRNTDIDCYGYGRNSFSCSQSSNGGGFIGGLLRGMEQGSNSNAASELAQAVAKACMADYGWVKR